MKKEPDVEYINIPLETYPIKCPHEECGMKFVVMCILHDGGWMHQSELDFCPYCGRRLQAIVEEVPEVISIKEGIWATGFDSYD